MFKTRDCIAEGARLFRRGWRPILVFIVAWFAYSTLLDELPKLLVDAISGDEIVGFLGILAMLLISAVGTLFSLLPAAWALGDTEGGHAWREALRLLVRRRNKVLRTFLIMLALLLGPIVALLIFALFVYSPFLQVLFLIASVVFIFGVLFSSQYACYYALRDADTGSEAFGYGFHLLKRYFGRTLLLYLIQFGVSVIVSSVSDALGDKTAGGLLASFLSFPVQMVISLSLVALFRFAEQEDAKKYQDAKRYL